MQHDPDRALISVIVPTFQDAHELQSCLEALRTQDTCLPFEVIVVNSDSKQHIDLPDGLPGRVVNCDLPLAPGAARNCGAKHSQAKYLAFTDADCQPSSAYWIQEMQSVIHNDDC